MIKKMLPKSRCFSMINEISNFITKEYMVRRKNVPGLIGKLRYKDDSLNFIFVRKYAHSKNISM